jgi:hypothetical protein
MGPTVSDLVGLRDAGYLRVGVTKAYIGESLPEVLLRLGMRLYGKDQCRELDRDEAFRLLVAMFTRGLAYNTEHLEPEEAQGLAKRILLDFFPTRSRLLTNIDATVEELISGTYGSFWGTEATFCVALVARGDASTAAVWIEEED